MPMTTSSALGKAMSIAKDYIPALRLSTTWTITLGIATGQLDSPTDPFLIGPPLSLCLALPTRDGKPNQENDSAPITLITAWLLAGNQRLLTTTLPLNDLNGYLTLVWSLIYASGSSPSPSPRRLYTLTPPGSPPPTNGQQWPKWLPGDPLVLRKPFPSGIAWKQHPNLPSWIASGIIQPA